MAPAVYLISRKLTEEQSKAVADALSLTPVDVVIVTCPQDVEIARKYSEHVTGLHRPIAVLADFTAPLTAVNEDGSLEVVNV